MAKACYAPYMGWGEAKIGCLIFSPRVINDVVKRKRKKKPNAKTSKIR